MRISACNLGIAFAMRKTMARELISIKIIRQILTIIGAWRDFQASARFTSFCLKISITHRKINGHRRESNVFMQSWMKIEEKVHFCFRANFQKKPINSLYETIFGFINTSLLPDHPDGWVLHLDYWMALIKENIGVFWLNVFMNGKNVIILVARFTKKIFIMIICQTFFWGLHAVDDSFCVWW